MSRGNTLVETIIAFFLLAGAAASLLFAIHGAMRRSQETQQVELARSIAESKLVEMREWAAAGNFRQPSDLSVWTGPAQADPDHPVYLVQTRASLANLESPCSPIQIPNPLKRQLTQSCAKVEVRVSWGANSNYRITSLLAESPRQVLGVAIQGNIPSPMTGRQSVEVTLVASDASGVIPDAMGEWWLEPISGVATVTPGVSGNVATLKNEVSDPQGNLYVKPGTCTLGVTYKYGTQVINATRLVNLGP